MFLCYRANFDCCKWPNIEPTIQPFGHTDWCSCDCDKFQEASTANLNEGLERVKGEKAFPSLSLSLACLATKQLLRPLYNTIFEHSCVHFRINQYYLGSKQVVSKNVRLCVCLMQVLSMILHVVYVGSYRKNRTKERNQEESFIFKKNKVINSDRPTSVGSISIFLFFQRTVYNFKANK